MKRTSTCVVAVASLMLPGCAPMPQTAEEFRKAVPGATFAKIETYEVSRPMKTVAATFRRKAPECLSVAVRTVSRTSTSYQNILTEYKPTVLVSAARVELHVQQLHKTGVVYPSKPPEGGIYLVVVDAYPLPGNRTRIQTFGPSMAYDVLYRAIRGWATGDNLGCPDMTKIG